MGLVNQVKTFSVLLAEDSEHDIRAVERVWVRKAIRNPLCVVRDGAECLDYLLRRGLYGDVQRHPRPGVVLLDINLPKWDGFEVLRQIKETPGLRRLPVIMLTTSSRIEDVHRSYDLGANAYITKPAGIENLSKVLLTINTFWELAGLPDHHDNDGRH